MKTNTLLKEIANWRKQLILDLSQQLLPQKVDLDRQLLPQIAQDLINQIVTLHICQDHGIEVNASLLQPYAVTEDLIENLINEDQFHLATERFSALKHACQISVLPIELLGQLHEQFLTLHQVIDRKAQGVYYTPTAIIDYTIRHTVSTVLPDQLVNRTLTDLQRNHVSLRILDPACGSGAFLLRAYQFLLDWYQTQYQTALEQYRAQLYQNHQGNWQLTIAAKQHILLQHIYGLDINQQAVEVAKRSLLLQMLSGSITESQIQPRHRLDCLSDKVSLNTNLLCGNALVDWDFYDKHKLSQFMLEETNQINAFSWENAFPTVIQAGGFDVILGNPPWVFTRSMSIDDRIKQYYQTKYLKPLTPLQPNPAKQTGKVNLFILFLFKFIELLHPQGRIGIVVPNTLLRTTVYETARKYMLDRCSIEQIVDLGGSAFSGITVSSTVLILGKNLDNSTIKLISTVHSIESQQPSTLLKKSDFLKNTGYVFNIFLNPQNSELFEKLNAISTPLKHLADAMIEGIVCRKDQIRQGLPHQELQYQPLQLRIGDRENQNENLDKNQYKRLLEGKDIARYCITFREKYILFDRQQLHRPRPDYVWNAKEKIILRRIGGGDFALVGALDTEQYYAFASTNNILLGNNHRYNIRYVLALLNSKLLNYYYIQNFTNRSRLTVNIAKTFLEQLPIRSINFACPVETLQHDRLVTQVDFLQALHQQLQFASDTSQQQELWQKIEAIDQQIDQWVYELYELTETEIALIKTSYRKPYQST